jgi:nitrite reductase (NADH) small subunit
MDMNVETVVLGPVEQIPMGEGRTFVVGDEPVTVFRTRDGRLFASSATCPHGQGPLADGLIGGTKVVCPLHGFAFDLGSGRCLNGNCDDLRTFAACAGPEGEIRLELARREGSAAA